jgi:hypothetical protein
MLPPSQPGIYSASTENLKDSMSTTKPQILGDRVVVAPTGAASSESSEPSQSYSDNDTENSDTCEKPTQLSLKQTNTVPCDKKTIESGQSAQDEADILTAIKVLQVVETYSTHGKTRWHGLAGYVPLVVDQIRAGVPIRLMFSGFGFKSPLAENKVLGSIPDLGEKLALAHLDGLCSNIATVYDKGAEMHICLDGLVYNGSYIPASRSASR